MRIIALTDLHAKTTVLTRLANLLSAVEVVILCGDISHFGREAEMKAIIKELRNWNPHVFAVSGNCDYPESEQYLVNEGISLHARITSFGDYYLTGLAGSLPCPGRTPQEYSEAEYSNLLDSMEIPSDKPLILVSHQPPFGTLNDQVSPLRHVGSTSVRRFIEKHQPLICLTGHIHEGIAIDYIGKSVIVNPGPAADGNYALVELSGSFLENIKLRNLFAK